MHDLTQCLRCGAPLVDTSRDHTRACARCGTPHARHDLPLSKFPLTIKLISCATDEVVWSRTITADEAQGLAKVEIPSFANSVHYPVRAEIEYADGTTEVKGMS